MEDIDLKNTIVLKNLPSNIVKEAYIVLKSKKVAKKIQKINKQTDRDIEYNDKYVIKEAEMLVAECVEKIENSEQKVITNAQKNKNIKRVVLESRPEFIDYDVISEISKICENKVVEIGIGLETSNDFIRNKCVNKGFTFEKYIKAVCRIKRFNNIKVLTYLTVKPLFLTINESIEDVINSVMDICEYTDIISLEPVSIQKNTLVEYLYQRNLYSIPKGWMIRDIVIALNKKDVLNKFELRIGGFEFYPIPELVINNCNNCNKSLYKAIDYYNSTKKIDKIIELSCDCYKEYEAEKARMDNEKPLEDRITDIMNNVLSEVIY